MSDEVSTNTVNLLFEIDQKISDSLSGAKSYLLSKFKHPTSSKGEASGGWSQFLNEDDEPPSVTGTAHGIIALKACGEQMHSEVISKAIRFIKENARPSGGWTKPNLYNYCSLTRVTCLGLRALIEAGETSTERTVKEGLSWLLDAQNDDGGWGNMSRDGKSDITSTSYAIQALAGIPGIGADKRVLKSISRGRDWLLKVRNEDHSWGETPRKPGTIAHTSEAVEALLASGVDRSDLKSVQDWLSSHIDEDGQIIERYLIEYPRVGGTVTITWTQVSRERALIALLKLRTSITTSAVMDSVRKVLGRQVGHTYWRSDAYPNSEPIWAIKEAVIGLRHYKDILKGDLASITLSGELSSLRNDIKELSARILRLEAQIAKTSFRSRISRTIKFLKRPAVMVALLTTLLIVLYIGSRSWFTFPHSDILIGILAIMGFGFSLFRILTQKGE